MPFHHQHLLAQTVKGILVRGGDAKHMHYDFYNFSGLKGQTKISRNGLHFFSSKVTLVFASPNQEFINYFLKSMFDFPQVEVGSLVLMPDSVERELDPDFKEVSKYICISPLVLLEPSFNQDSGKRFIVPDSDEFSDLLYDASMGRMEGYGYTEEQLAEFFRFQVVPDRDYLNRLRDMGKKFARIYPLFDQDIRYEVRGYTFPFTLYAAPDVQEFVFTTGLGLYTGKGFGMLDIANSDPSSRSVPYDYTSAANNSAE